MWSSAVELRGRIDRGEISCEEITHAALDRIRALESSLQAFVTVTEETALAQAQVLDARRARGEALPPLAGLPVAIKDNFCTAGIRTTCSSRILGDWRPPYDATVTRRIVEAGACVVGKTNMDEFAMGSSTENSGFFTTRNPWNLAKVPGGSSGGSAAAVAAGMVPLGLGSDTGGSVRQPAAFCGIVGLKPTYGRVSRYGLVAFASSLDQIGPLTRDVRDTALLMNVIAGHDPLDSTSVDRPVPDYTAALTGDVRGVKIGVPREYLAQGVDESVRVAVFGALERLRELGASYEEISTPTAGYALPVYYIIAPAEASSNLARYDGVRYGIRSREAGDVISLFQTTRDQGFGPEVKHRIMLGTYALSSGYYDAYYLRAQQVRTRVKQEMEAALEQYDVLVTPTAPSVAFGIGEKVNDPLAMKLSDVCTVTINMVGNCAVSVPCGIDGGLPIGLQIIGRPFDEEKILRVAHAYEQATDWHSRHPKVEG